ncbi:MAG: transglutaminase-like domain-containing protein [Bacteroidales bacterium]|nr:transglutaminase-like domain-containing protein [Bacteroidales bacterium]
MKKCLILIGIVSLLGCVKKDVKVEKNNLDKNYELRCQLLKDYTGTFFDELDNRQLTEREKYYLKFLFTYMPLSDFADYDFDFYAEQVRYSIKATETFSWAKNIPEDIFMHYVLPPRMNNENMDSARIVFFKELKERLLPMNLTMEQAALEVNHWCHEKVNYRPTDERTISPLGAVRSAFGRCGEESTFTTTALRAAGIPARQVYTPRWAHTDDNHAWVEVWIDGKWYYMGACEPEPVLNKGWFDVPASRAMLVHTKQFGKLPGEEETYISETENFSWVNTLETYAPVKILEVLVVDENDNPIEGADVQFQLYNYAELFPLHVEKTDKSGKVKFKTGYGSLEIYVDNGEKFTSTSVLPDMTEVKIILSGKNVFPAEFVKYIPPKAGEAKVLDSGLIEENERRIAVEDSIRTAYETTFYTAERAKEILRKYKYPDNIEDFLIKSRGNWKEIEEFLIVSAEKSLQKEAVRLLKVISEKDLRDTRADILTEHMDYALKYYDENIPEEIFDKYVLNPRISFEMLKPYRKLILTDLDDKQINEYKNNIDVLTHNLKSDIATKLQFDGREISGNELNAYRVPLTPSGVHKTKLSDDRSFKIYFAAYCRSLGIPSRIESASGLVQVYSKGKWTDIILDEPEGSPEIKRGTVKLASAYNNRELKYRVHFALVKLTNAKFHTVDLGWEIPVSEFNEGIELQEGTYMLLSAVRNEDGSVIVKRKYFDLHENEVVTVDVELPEVTSEQTFTDKFVNSQVYSLNGEAVNSEKIGEKSYTVYCWLDPSKEPSKHIVRDLSPMINELKNNNIDVCFIINEKDFDPLKHGFPDNLNYYYDKDLNLLMKNIKCSAGGSGIIFPQIKMTDPDGNIILSSEGYTIGIGELVLTKVL